MFRLRSSTLRARLVPWLILSLLLAQGLRLCIPAEPHSGHEARVVAHLESVITSAADQHEPDAADDGLDVSLSAIFKVFQANPLLFAVIAVVLILPLLQRSSLGLHPDFLSFRPLRGYSLTPPLRAPPR